VLVAQLEPLMLFTMLEILLLRVLGLLPTMAALFTAYWAPAETAASS